MSRTAWLKTLKHLRKGSSPVRKKKVNSMWDWTPSGLFEKRPSKPQAVTLLSSMYTAGNVQVIHISVLLCYTQVTQNTVCWHRMTKTLQKNPLLCQPVLFLNSGNTLAAIHKSQKLYREMMYNLSCFLIVYCHYCMQATGTSHSLNQGLDGPPSNLLQ